MKFGKYPEKHLIAQVLHAGIIESLAFGTRFGTQLRSSRTWKKAMMAYNHKWTNMRGKTAQPSYQDLKNMYVKSHEEWVVYSP